MRPGPQQFQFGPRAARQIAQTVRFVERLPRSRQPHRRRSIAPAGTATSVKWVSFITSSALTNQATLAGCSVVLDWYANTGGITQVDVFNELGWQADAGVLGYAAYRPADAKWVIIEIPCPAGNS